MKAKKTRLTLVIGAIAILVLALVSWLFILSPRLSEAAKVQADADQLATANLALHNQYNQGVTMAKDAPSAAREAQALFATMPQQADLPAVIEQITAAAEAAGIPAKQVAMISTSVPKPLSGGTGAAPGANEAVQAGVNIATMQVDISATGTQEQVLTFLDNLQALDRALLITSTQLTEGGTVPGDVPGTRKGPATQAIQIGGTMFVLESKLPDLVASVQTLLPPDLGGTGTPTPTASPGASAAAVPNGSAAPSSAASPIASPAASSTPVTLQP